MAKANEEKKIAYLKSNNFLRLWSERECEICEVEGVGLSMERAPPPLLYARSVAVVPERTVREVPVPKKKVPEDPYLNVFKAVLKTANAVADFSDWLTRPPAPLLPVAATKPKPSTPAVAVRKVPPFDIQDVPKAMRKLHMPMAAKLQERWFAGQENYSRTADDLLNEIDQNGARYASSMVDATTIKMEWILSFNRAKKAFETLMNESLNNQKSIAVLKTKLSPYRSYADIVAWNIAKSDFLDFHHRFQFQLGSVNATWGSRIAQYLDRMTTAGGVPDDLTGALGSFNFYVAVRYASFNRSGNRALITDVSVYVRDPYEFSDEQYLGHWSPSHVAVVPIQQISSFSKWCDYPVADGAAHEKDSVLYPVKNKDYRDWRQKHRQGGDFMIYSDRMNVKLNVPIAVDFL